MFLTLLLLPWPAITKNACRPKINLKRSKIIDNNILTKAIALDMAYLNYDKFALNQDDDKGTGDELMGDDTDTESDEGPLVETEEGDDYPDLNKDSEEE